MGPNSQFCRFFYLFSQNETEIDSEWSISPDSQLFPSFATKASHFWRNLKNYHCWGGTLANFFTFPTFSNHFTPRRLKMKLRLTQNGQFHLIHNFSHLLPPIFFLHFWRNLKNYRFWGRGTLANFLSFPTFSNHFTPMRLKMTHNGKFCQKSGLDWVKMPNFAGFSIFSPK